MKKLSFAMLLVALLLAIIMQQQPSKTSQSLPNIGKFSLSDVAYLRIKHGENITLECSKEGGKWRKDDDATVEIQAVAVGQLLVDLQSMKVKRIASHQAEHHARFAADHSGVQVLLKRNNGEILLDVMVGKAATDLVSTYLRLTAENTVVTVNKTLTWQVKRTPDAWLVRPNKGAPLE